MVGFDGKKVEGKKIIEINERTWTRVTLSSFIGFRYFLYFHFLSIKLNRSPESPDNGGLLGG
jgi:hypothetical protein